MKGRAFVAICACGVIAALLYFLLAGVVDSQSFGIAGLGIMTVAAFAWHFVSRRENDGTGRIVRNAAGETLNVNAHWLVPAVRQAGIKDFCWHDLRHTYASRLRQAGVPLGNIAELLGHKGLAMSRRYAHLSISNLHDAVARIANSTPVAPEVTPQAPATSYLN